VSAASARAAPGRAAWASTALAASRRRRRAFFLDGLQPGADRPHRLLRQRALERRHVDRAVAGHAVADALDEVLVAFVAERQHAQVGCDAAGNPAEAVAAGTVLVVGRVADADGGGVLAVGVLFQPVTADLLERRGVDRLRRDIAVGMDEGGADRQCGCEGCRSQAVEPLVGLGHVFLRCCTG